MVSDLLWNIGGMLGRMCKVDPVTENQARGRFARICVEIDITKPLLGELNIENRSVKVEYESLGIICFKCGRYGHSKESCRDGVVEPRQEETMCDVQDNTGKEETPYGPWLLVSYGKQGNRNYRGRYGKPGSSGGGYGKNNVGGQGNGDGNVRNGSDSNMRKMD